MKQGMTKQLTTFVILVIMLNVFFQDALAFVDAKEIKLSQTSLTLYVYETMQLSATITPSDATNKDISWKSVDADIVTVSKTGLVTAFKPGKTIVKATINGTSIKDICTVEVKAKMTSLGITEESVTIKEGETYQLKVEYEPKDAADTSLNWTTTSDTIATVSSGLVKALKHGNCRIIVANPKSGISDYCSVRVEEGVSPTPSPTVSPTCTPTSTPTPSKIVHNFYDIKGHWCENYVGGMISKGIINGYEDGTFKPDNNITRAEAVTVISKAIGLKPVENPVFTFSDSRLIPNWAAGYIKETIDKGIISGYEDNTINPNGSLTRDEMTAIIVRALKLQPDATKPSSFSDIETFQDWSKGFILKASDMGLIKGYEDNSFRPKNKITRAEVSVICYKVLETLK